MQSADDPPTDILQLKRWWLRTLIVWLLVPALSLQALASTVPRLLFPHNHQTLAGKAAFDCHTRLEHSAPAVGPHCLAAHHPHSLDYPDNHRLTDECSCGWCVACPIPITGPLPLAAENISHYPPVAQHFLTYISDQPQPPPRG